MVRCRPVSESEKGHDDGSSAVTVSGRSVTLCPGPRAHSYAKAGEEGDQSLVFAYDHAFGPTSDQLSVFAACGAPLVQELLKGFNATIFAYGQTGSGKTHTMIGNDLEPGLIPRTAWYLFERLQALNAVDASLVSGEASVEGPSLPTADAGDGGDARADSNLAEGLHPHPTTAAADAGVTEQEAALSGKHTFRLTATYLQIYNETLVDMLAESGAGGGGGQELRVRTSPSHGIFVAGLSEHPVTCPQDVLDLLERGNRSRATATTKMNATSSRSHAVFTLNLVQDVPVGKQAEGESGGAEKDVGALDAASFGAAEAETGGGDGEFAVPLVRRLRSKINLVDLAGSERAKLSGADENAALMKECVNINKSLSALGNVIAALSEGRTTHVPYRESKLTQLLEESLGGNAQTIMINAVSVGQCTLVPPHATCIASIPLTGWD